MQEDEVSVGFTETVSATTTVRAASSVCAAAEKVAIETQQQNNTYAYLLLRTGNFAIWSSLCRRKDYVTSSSQRSLAPLEKDSVGRENARRVRSVFLAVRDLTVNLKIFSRKTNSGRRLSIRGRYYPIPCN